MRKISVFCLFLTPLLGLLFLLSVSCDKSESSGKVPVLSTLDVTDITQTSAVCGGKITSDGGAAITEKGVCWSENDTPTITDSKTSNGNDTDSFVSNISGLTKGTKYHVRAYATNNAGTGYGNIIEFTSAGGGNLTISDIEGNVYPIVTIGTQVWMAKNLATTRYNDNFSIPLVSDNNAWYNLSTPGFCWYSNSKAMYGDTYGGLYNWYAVNTGLLCPTGWHIPTEADWTTLVNHLGGVNSSGGALKEPGTSHWTTPNTGATNASGFTALPGGSRFDFGVFGNNGTYGHFWTATEDDSLNAWNRYLHYTMSSVAQSSVLKRNGFSVRCIKD